MTVEPVNFLRYPGSKRRMLAFLSQYLPKRDDICGRYVEPFLGSGAVFLSFLPRNAFLSDINQELIDIFLGIQQDYTAVWQKYRNFGTTREDYYQVRDEYKPRSLTGRAARSLFLNRTCFKGMWRHNNNGNFNVGYGGQNRRWVIDLNILHSISKFLKGVNYKCCDFEETLNTINKGDFIFCDPPYKPGWAELTNSHYSSRQFSLKDQERLANRLNNFDSIEIKWALTISSHPNILAFYKNNYAIFFKRGTGSSPGKIVDNPGEVLITNYKTIGGIIL